MDIQVLVAYATKHGATAEIAEKIGQVLRQTGLQADVLPADRVSDLTPYEAVVLGSAVYIGQWRKEAVKFFKANEKMLTERPVWLFSSGPTGEGDPKEHHCPDGTGFPRPKSCIIMCLRATSHSAPDVKGQPDDAKSIPGLLSRLL